MEAKIIKDRLFLRKVVDSYVLHRIKDGILTIEGDSQYTIGGIEPFYKLSLKNCQAIELGYDLYELADEWVNKNNHKWSNNNNEVGDNYGSFKEGAETILKILGDKKFSEEDMKLSYKANEDGWVSFQYFMEDFPIQTEWDVIIKMRPASLVYISNLVIEELDADGCLILKRK